MEVFGWVRWRGQHGYRIGRLGGQRMSSVERVIGNLTKALNSSLPDTKASYLKYFRTSKLKNILIAYSGIHGLIGNQDSMTMCLNYLKTQSVF